MILIKGIGGKVKEWRDTPFDFLLKVVETGKWVLDE